VVGSGGGSVGAGPGSGAGPGPGGATAPRRAVVLGVRAVTIGAAGAVDAATVEPVATTDDPVVVTLASTPFTRTTGPRSRVGSSCNSKSVPARPSVTPTAASPIPARRLRAPDPLRRPSPPRAGSCSHASATQSATRSGEGVNAPGRADVRVGHTNGGDSASSRGASSQIGPGPAEPAGHGTRARAGNGSNSSSCTGGGNVGPRGVTGGRPPKNSRSISSSDGRRADAERRGGRTGGVTGPSPNSSASRARSVSRGSDGSEIAPTFRAGKNCARLGGVTRDAGHRRAMHRTTVASEIPIPGER